MSIRNCCWEGEKREASQLRAEELGWGRRSRRRRPNLYLGPLKSWPPPPPQLPSPTLAVGAAHSPCWRGEESTSPPPA